MEPYQEVWGCYRERENLDVRNGQHETGHGGGDREQSHGRMPNQLPELTREDMPWAPPDPAGRMADSGTSPSNITGWLARNIVVHGGCRMAAVEFEIAG